MKDQSEYLECQVDTVEFQKVQLLCSIFKKQCLNFQL